MTDDTSQKRRKPAFTEGELKTYSNAAQETGLDEWAVERTDADGVVMRFVCGAIAGEFEGESEWDRHEPR